MGLSWTPEEEKFWVKLTLSDCGLPDKITVKVKGYGPGPISGSLKMLKQQLCEGEVYNKEFNQTQATLEAIRSNSSKFALTPTQTDVTPQDALNYMIERVNDLRRRNE